ncbi:MULTISPECIES: ABC transporter permease [unclassified Mycobacterium]|uniref:MlaE family ABC transporter permease n=1 Tax=unclassified Mycobacterium TaxID=2642494 RepID=UPI00073FDC19|nr:MULTISPECIES: ABC transporter permease [unclassified Mycobacterium]KUH83133.1 ABC transporter permease [Mycobacterium sp. GA-0227b]KUH84457.1 ABC transporter permease [Mycobacterium sp. GA-1999]KUH89407.1 ABC transporter permease [Mycobacterium sp. IS-1556]
MVASTTLRTPVREVGAFFAMSLDALVTAFTTRFSWREFIEQAWFTARVSALPAIMLTIPFHVLVTFVLSVLFAEIGAQDLGGGGAALAAVSQSGPFMVILIVGGAAATAMCADLGARTIREEIDAMEVTGVDPIQRLVVPRIAAIILNTVLLFGLSVVGALAGCFFFSVYVLNVTPGSFAASLTFLIGLPDLVISTCKALIFGLVAGLVACYKGLTVGGGPQGVGNAVNETVVYTIMILFVVNTVVTAATVSVVLR